MAGNPAIVIKLVLLGPRGHIVKIISLCHTYTFLNHTLLSTLRLIVKRTIVTNSLSKNIVIVLNKMTYNYDHSGTLFISRDVPRNYLMRNVTRKDRAYNVNQS